MKKQKKKRESKDKFKGKPPVEPLEIVIVDGDELLMLFSLSNRALKMIKCGEVFNKTYLKDGKRCQMQFMHRDVYEQGFKQAVELKLKLQAEKKKKAAEEAKEAPPIPREPDAPQTIETGNEDDGSEKNTVE